MTNDLTLNSPIYDTTNPKFGSAALDSGYGVAPVGAMGSGPTFTWECWIRRTTIPSTIQACIGSTVAGWLGINTSGQAQFNGATGNVDIIGSTSLCDGAYHHLAMVGTPAGFAAFVDGVQIGTSATVQAYPSSVTFGIGAFNTGVFACNSMDIDEAAFFSIAKYSGAFTPPAAPYTGAEAGLISLYHLDGDGADSTGAAINAIAPNDPSIVYSPYNWNVTSGAAKSINAGAYFKTMFSGNSIVLNFDVTNNSAPVSEIYYRIDGYEAQSPWTKANVAATITPTLPSDTSAFPYHTLEVMIKSTSETINRWNAPSNTAVVFTGLTLATGGGVVTPVPLTKNILMYGTSISEGVRTVNETAPNDTDRNDAMMGWAYRQGALLGVEVGLVGFGGSGLTVTGSGNVPPLTASYNLLYAGQARSFSPLPSLIVLEEGTNDSAVSDASITAALITVLNGLLAACPGTPIAVMRPFNGSKAAALQAGIAGCNTPSRVTYVDTAGYFDTALGADGSTYHPSGPNDIAKISGKVANAIRPLLNPRRFTLGVTS